MSSARFDQLIDEAEQMKPSEDWPPILKETEEILFSGHFITTEWLQKNVSYAVGFVLVALSMASFLGIQLTLTMVMILMAMIILGCAITYFMYRRQHWQITDQAIYFSNHQPIKLSSLKQVRGFGSTVRLVGRFGFSQNLVGVSDAKKIRNMLIGRNQ